jgi:hypothetical protein
VLTIGDLIMAEENDLANRNGIVSVNRIMDVPIFARGGKIVWSGSRGRRLCMKHRIIQRAVFERGSKNG